MKILFTKHEPVARVLQARYRFKRVYPTFYREMLANFPPESTVVGNLPVPVVSLICAAGHHYEHVMIPGASKPGAFDEARLREVLTLTEFHVSEID